MKDLRVSDISSRSNEKAAERPSFAVGPSICLQGHPTWLSCKIENTKSTNYRQPGFGVRVFPSRQAQLKDGPDIQLKLYIWETAACPIPKYE